MGKTQPAYYAEMPDFAAFGGGDNDNPDCLIRDHIKVEWVSLGEGWKGDYNPDDPDDEELLRFDVYEKDGTDWEEVDSGSYCTCMPVTCSEELKQKGLERIMNRVEPVLKAGASIKKVCEELSYMNPGWFAPRAKKES